MRFGAVVVWLAACGSGSHPAAIDASRDAAADVPVDTVRDANTPAQTYLKAPDATAGNLFGASVAVAGDGQTFVVGAPGRASKTGAVYVFAPQGSVWEVQSGIGAANGDTNDEFGYAVSLSNDGSTLAVSALNERSCATGIGGDETSNDCPSGAVYVYARTATTWALQAYVKPSNTTATNGYVRAFGQALALSGDGNTLTVGDPAECSNATGIDGDQTNVSACLSGAVFVFARTGTTWSQQAYVKASNSNAGDNFGGAVSLSSSGDVMVVGAGSERSAARGVNGSQLDNSVTDAGAAYVFVRAGTTWSQQAYAKASNTGSGDFFGLGVATSGDGATVAIGAPGEASAATGIGGDQTDDSQLHAGAAYVFANDASAWSQQAYVKEQTASHNGDYFANQLALSANGNVLVGGAFLAQIATGVQTGAAYQYVRTGTSWSVGALYHAQPSDAFDAYGSAIGMSSDASLLVIGAPGEASAGMNPLDNSAPNAGAVYIIQ